MGGNLGGYVPVSPAASYRPAASLFGYMVAVIASAVTVGLRWFLDPWLGDHLPLVTLFAAVAATGWFGGYGPAFLSAGLGYLGCDYLFIEPRGGFGFSGLGNPIGEVAYFTSCAIIIGFSAALRQAQRKAEDGRNRRGSLSPASGMR